MSITFGKTLRGALVAAGAFVTMHHVALAQNMTIQPSPNGQVSIVVDFDVKPADVSDFEKTFHRSVTCARLEPGNITFNVHKVIGAPRQYVLYERWRSVDALNSHFARPYTKKLFAMFDRDLTKPIALRWLEDMQPSPVGAPPNTDPTTLSECR